MKLFRFILAILLLLPLKFFAEEQNAILLRAYGKQEAEIKEHIKTCKWDQNDWWCLDVSYLLEKDITHIKIYHNLSEDFNSPDVIIARKDFNKNIFFDSVTQSAMCEYSRGKYRLRFSTGEKMVIKRTKLKLKDKKFDESYFTSQDLENAIFIYNSDVTK